MAKLSKFDAALAQLDASIARLESIEVYLGLHEDNPAAAVTADIEKLQHARTLLVNAGNGGEAEAKPKRVRKKKAGLPAQDNGE